MLAPVAIITVADVENMSLLLCELFDWKSAHGGSHFEILQDQDNKPTLMLHCYEADDHARFKNAETGKQGLGQSLYVFSAKIEKLYQTVQEKKIEVVEALALNQNSGAQEFTFRIDEGHQFTACDSDKWLSSRG